ncbi:hypothetical protein [Vibrio pectenicida]|uniref:Uncharacterized protein n=1 Tax=Vibrio pectenicida TaxID=62763 RepID=A0A3R9E9S4_9VIBR|nr:hypothetical protein [Vibrio pectenicida]RSD29166.1 hypothetical protein EJA03_18405 [Vibrio pectenicida]
MTTYKLLTDDSASKALLSNTNIYNWETRTDAEIDTENPESRAVSDDTIKQGTGYVDTLSSTIGLISNIIGFTRKEAPEENTFHAMPITFVNNTKSVIMTSITGTGDTDNTVTSDRPGVILPKGKADVVIESALDTNSEGDSTNKTVMYIDVWGVKTDTSLTTSGQVDWGWRIEVERSAYSTKRARSTLRVTKVVRLRNDGTIGQAESDGKYVYDESTTGQFNIFGVDEPREDGLPLVAFYCPEHMSEHNRGEFVITLLEHSIPLSTSEQPPSLPAGATWDNPAADPSKTKEIVIHNDTPNNLPIVFRLTRDEDNYGGASSLGLYPGERYILSVDESYRVWAPHIGNQIGYIEFTDDVDVNSPLTQNNRIILSTPDGETSGLLKYGYDEEGYKPMVDLNTGSSHRVVKDENGIAGNDVYNYLWTWYEKDNVVTITIGDKTP